MNRCGCGCRAVPPARKPIPWPWCSRNIPTSFRAHPGSKFSRPTSTPRRWTRREMVSTPKWWYRTRAFHLHFAPRRPDAAKETQDFQPAGAPEGLHGDLKALREADRVTLARYAPPGVLVNAGLQVLQFRGDTSPYLKPPTGKASFD